MEQVISCIKIKDWTNPKGEPVPIYKVDLSDGRSGQSFGKEIPVGTPEGEIIIEDKGSYGLSFKQKPKNGFRVAQQKGNESFALSYAKDLVVADKVTIDKIIPTAEKLYQWLESKRK